MFFGAGGAFAQQLQIAEAAPILQAPSLGSDAFSPVQISTAPTASQNTLTPALLAAYVARRQAQQGFNVFGDAPQPQLTSALVSAYAATHYRSNAALDAIDNITAQQQDAPADPTSDQSASPSLVFAAFETTPELSADSISDDALADYANHYIPTAKRVAHANDEKNCLSTAIYHEARGESDNGQWAVANVIINRALSKRFPTTMCGVVYQNANEGRFHCQFTFACDGQSDTATERQAWIKANRIAAAAYSEFQHGQRPGVVPGSALYYHTVSVEPSWSNSYRQVAQIGAHVFFAPS